MHKTLITSIVFLLLLSSLASAEIFRPSNEKIPNGLFLSEIVPTTYEDYEYVYNGTFLAYFQDNPNTGLSIQYELSNVQMGIGPDDFQYASTNDLQFISAVQSVTGSGSGQVMDYPNAYGVGIDLSYTAGTIQLKEKLTIKNASVLPEVAQYMIDDGPVFLELNFLLNTNAQHIEVDGQEIDLTERKDTRTYNDVIVRDDNGNPLWHINKPFIEDATGNRAYGWLEFKVTNQNVYVSVGVPYSFLENATFPVVIDPTYTVDYSPIPALHLIEGIVYSDEDEEFANYTDITVGVSDDNDTTSYLTREYTATPLANNVLSWKFEETSGSTAVDNSGNGRIGSIIGTTYDLNVSGDIGSGIYMTIADTVSRTETYPILANNDFLECIRFSTSVGATKIITEIHDGLVQPIVRFEVLSNGRLKITNTLGSSASALSSTIATLDNGSWYTACSYTNATAGTAHMYIDGTLRKSGGIGTKQYVIGSQLHIGDNLYDGYADELCIWDGPNLNAVSLITSYETSGCPSTIINSSEGQALSGKWIQTYNESWNWYLYARKTTPATNLITIYPYYDNNTLDTTYSLTDELVGNGWFSIPIDDLMIHQMNESSNYTHTHLRFHTSVNANFSEFYLRQEINTTSPPNVTNCVVNDDFLYDSDVARFQCDIDGDIDTTTFTIGGLNYSAIKNDSIYYADYICSPNGNDQIINFSLVYSLDILGNTTEYNPINVTTLCKRHCDYRGEGIWSVFRNFWCEISTAVTDFQNTWITTNAETTIISQDVNNFSDMTVNSGSRVTIQNGTKVTIG